MMEIKKQKTRRNMTGMKMIKPKLEEEQNKRNSQKKQRAISKIDLPVNDLPDCSL